LSATTAQEPTEQRNGHDEEIPNPLAHLSEEQIEELAKEFDAIHDDVYGDLGDRDRRYITAMIELHRRLAVMSRVLLLGAKYRPLWWAGMATNSSAKILENMEIGHNVMHGQWDWMNDPQIHSSSWDWDTASTAEAWKHSHNYVHHTFTNIRGKDKDLGYEIMRIDPHQPWHPVYLFQPLYNIVLMALFEWGVAVHDLDFDAIRSGEKSKAQVARELKGIGGKARAQITKDYIAWPLISALAAGAATFAWESREAIGETVANRPKRSSSRISGAVARHRRRRSRKGFESAARKAWEAGRETFGKAAKANATANVVRNLWSHAIIFCGHFPDQTYTFNEAEVEDESRGAWYVRQLVGAANIEGSPFFHVASGNLSYQVEHHLYPDMPSSRYAEIAPRVKDICERYGLPYNTGPFFQQWGMVNRTILRLAFPGGHPRPKPGPYKGDDGESAASNGHGQQKTEAPTGPEGSGPEQPEEGVRVEVPDRG
jgi:NADPH-dependent stearoyl-CoA 9-desaturase